MSDAFKPKYYAKFRYEMRLLDRPTLAFVMGLKVKFPEAFNELAALAHDFGGVAMVYAIRACMDISTEARRNMIQIEGYKSLQQEGGDHHATAEKEWTSSQETRPT